MQVRSEYNCNHKKTIYQSINQSMSCYWCFNIAFTVGVWLTNPTGRCQTRPAGCCPSGLGCGQGLAMDQCGGPSPAECQYGSLHPPSSGPKGSPGRRLLGRPGRLHLKGELVKVKVRLCLIWTNRLTAWIKQNRWADMIKLFHILLWYWWEIWVFINNSTEETKASVQKYNHFVVQHSTVTISFSINKYKPQH